VAFAYAPSARALIHARQIAAAVPKETLFAVNNPDGSLHYADQEVNAVTRHFSAPWVANHKQATRNTALLALPQCDVYHFACHGNNNWQSPLESALQMYSQVGRVPLTVADLLGLEGRLHAQLAFLSACETGLIGTELPDEMVGLAAGFMQAGAARVISSLWPVNDESTAILAAQFYENWKGNGMSPLEALVAAQCSVRDEGDNGRWAHPYYWAAFTLTGMCGALPSELQAGCAVTILNSKGGNRMEQEQGSEPVQDTGETWEEAPIALDRSEELFGEPREPPSFYHCAQCNEDILAQDVAWDPVSYTHLRAHET